MTTIYLIRSAGCEDLQDLNSEISEKGLQEIKAIEAFLQDKAIDNIYVSAHSSAAKTMESLASANHIPVYSAEEFNERKIGPRVLNLESFEKRQWSEPEYKLAEGESFFDVQDRIIDGLDLVVTQQSNKTNVICSHSMALGTLIQFFDETFDCDEFMRTITVSPWMVKMEFDKKAITSLEEIRCI